MTRPEHIEARVREAKQRFRAVGNLVPNLLWSSEPGGEMNWYNEQWLQFTGQTIGHALGWGWADAVHPDDRDFAVRRFEEALAMRAPVQQEYRLRRADGVYRWFLARASPLLGAECEVLQWFGAATDIDDIRRAADAMRATEEQLREAARQKNDFLAMLGHELRNPLAAIEAGVKILQYKLAQNTAAAPTLPVLARQVAHMKRLIDDVLDLARIDRGKLQVRRERINLNDTILQAIVMTWSAIEAAGHQVRRRFPRQPVVIHADAARLTQVLVNLLGNAVKFSPRRSVVDISLERERDAAVIRIADSGVGIPPELLPHIFEPFVQAKRSLASPEGGLGLGLAISRQLVEAHGGTIEARSAGENSGSEFIVRLPVGEPHREDTAG